MDAATSTDTYRLLAAALHLLPTLAWVILASSYCRSHGTARPQGNLLRLFRVLCVIVAVHYALNVAIDLVYPDVESSPSLLWQAACVLTKATTLAELAVLRHLLPLTVLGGAPPSRRWLAVNYGSAVLVGLASALMWDRSTLSAGGVVHAYLLIMTAAILWEIQKLTRGRGSDRWRPVIMVDLGPRGFAALGTAMFLGVVLLVLAEPDRIGANLTWAVIHSLVGVALAGIFALRILGEVLRRLVLGLASIAATAGIYFGARHTAGELQDPQLESLVHVAGVLLLAWVLGPGSVWLKNMVDRLLRRRSRMWDSELQAFLQSLQPEVGVEECRRRAVDEVHNVLRLHGAGMLPASRDGSASPTETGFATAGRIDLGPLAEVWPGSTADSLPERAFDLLWLDDLELQKALYDAGVTWVVPVVSPRTRWGHLFVASGPLGIAADGTKLVTLERFAHQLALVLDSAALLDRTVTIERELAQAGKLAAVGEMAARMAHEIRNPVTAARSLAQMMADEPDSLLNAEHARIITRELDRVEHQIRSLLTYARRETYRFEPVGVATLVRRTVDELEARLLAPETGVDLSLALDGEGEVRADPERLRQVLVNLVENAVDALGESVGARRLRIAVREAGAHVTLCVRDNGPGVSEEMLPKLFEPFVSDKTQGTGLGLAIARRIVEAHDGRITARTDPEGGAELRVVLPLLHSAPVRRPAASEAEPPLREAV